jgi:hypothetical protein
MSTMNWDCYPEHLRPSEPPTDEEVGTHELTEEEIVFARAHGILRVEEDGCGFVPKQWLEQLRKFRDAMRQPSLLRRIMPPVPLVAGVVPYKEPEKFTEVPLVGFSKLGAETGRFSGDHPNEAAPPRSEPECPECAYERETGQGAPVPHHCDQMAVDAGYYPEEDKDA